MLKKYGQIYDIGYMRTKDCFFIFYFYFLKFFYNVVVQQNNK